MIATTGPDGPDGAGGVRAAARLRVATLQYALRPVATFDAFAAQVAAHVAAAADRECRLLVFPEYFTLQLLALGEDARYRDARDWPLRARVRELARESPRLV